ncbi:MAG: EamA family transporter RarD [Alphaproteobacteria bacterium]|nr:EamA family transporter RarD [Alphaproteobacteria bacterium]
MKEQTKGFFYALVAYTIWGIFPFFFSLLKNVSLTEILIHRIIWAFFAVLAFIVIMSHRQILIKAIRSKIVMKRLVISAVLIFCHWLNFNWLVEQHRVVDASLGYFLFPLLSAFLGMVFLKEKQNAFSITAIFLACFAVVWLFFKIDHFPLLSLTLGLSFALYGLARKQVPVDSLTALVIETGMLMPLAFPYWLWLEFHHQSAIVLNDLPTSFLLICAGLLTATPLFCFAAAAKRLTLTTVGFMLYITSSLQFLIAIFYLKEPLSIHKLIAFIIIWCALAIYSFGAFRYNSKLKPQLNKN